MAFIDRRTLALLVGLVLGFALAVAGVIWSGLYNIAADDPHTRPIFTVLEITRDRSIDRRAAAIPVPDLSDPERALQGAGNYDAMCTGCHLTPGALPTELSRGLYPAPPDLTQASVEPARAFWVIKHGIKASGMPAWGPSMDDEYIWNMVAFLQELPGLDAAAYRDRVARSGGHSHGGGETDGHAHAAAAPPDGDAAAAAPPTGEASDGQVHVHDDGSLHDHGAEPGSEPGTPPPATDADPAPASPAPADPAVEDEKHDDHGDHHHS